MNTTENDKLIAEFIGMTYDNHNDQPNKYWELTDEQDFVSHNPYPQDKDLRFHSSWAWLMPVVEKIESKGFKTSIENNHFSIDGDENYFETKTFNTSKIQAVYDVVIEFIKWYNENQK